MKIRLTSSPSIFSSSVSPPSSLLESPMKIGILCAFLLHLLAYLLVSIPPLSLPSPFLFPLVEVARISPSWVLFPAQHTLSVPDFIQPPAPTLDEIFVLPAYGKTIAIDLQDKPLFQIDPRDVLAFLPTTTQFNKAIFIVSGPLASVSLLQKPNFPMQSLPTRLPLPHFFSYAMRVEPATGHPFWIAPLTKTSHPRWEELWVEEQLYLFRFSPGILPPFAEGVVEVILYP